MNSKINFKELKDFTVEELLSLINDDMKTNISINNVSEIIERVEHEKGTYPTSLLIAESAIKEVFFQLLLKDYFKLIDAKSETLVYRASSKENANIVLGIISEFTEYVYLDKNNIYLSTNPLLELNRIKKEFHLSPEFVKEAEKELFTSVVSLTDNIFPKGIIQVAISQVSSFLKELTFLNEEELKYFIDVIYDEFLERVVKSIGLYLANNHIFTFLVKTPHFSKMFFNCNLMDALKEISYMISITDGKVKITVVPL